MSQKPTISLIHIVISYSDYEELIKENPIVLLELKAKSCHSSNMVQSHYKIFSEKYVNFKFASIDVDHIGETNLKKIDNKLNLSAVPSFYLFMNGKLLDKLVAASADSLETFIKNYYDGEPVKSSNSNFEAGYSKEMGWNSVKSTKSQENSSSFKDINKNNFLSPSNIFSTKSKSNDHLNSTFFSPTPKSATRKNPRDNSSSREYSQSNLKKSNTAEKISHLKKK